MSAQELAQIQPKQSFGHPQEVSKPGDDTSEGVGTKLYREAELLWQGSTQGIEKSAVNAWDHPGESLLKVGAAAAIGGGLALLQGRAGLLKVGAEVAGLVFTYNFYKDIYSSGSAITGAMEDTWHSSKNFQKDKQIVSNTVGPFVVDSALMIGGGIAGGKVAHVPEVYNTFNSTLDKAIGLPTLEQEAEIRRLMFAKDPATLRHEDRVGDTSKLIAEKMGLPPGSVETTEKTGRFHDTGKINTPDDILLSPKKLDDITRPIMDRHAADTTKILSEKVDYPRRLRDVPEIAGAHHERLDGKGYPLAKTEGEIPIEARINTVADVVDAMASERSYKARSPIPQIYDRLMSGSGLTGGKAPTEFDPRVVKAFLDLPADKVFEPLLSDGGKLPPGTMKNFSQVTVGQIMEAFAHPEKSTISPALKAEFAHLYGDTVIKKQ